MTPNEENPVTPIPQSAQANGMSSQKASDGKHPVLIYIMILFVAAFLLMGLSFLSSQRRNSQTLGELQSSVSEIQNDRQHIEALQAQLDAAHTEIDTLEQDLNHSEVSLRDAEGRAKTQHDAYTALNLLYQLQQNYIAGNYDRCRTLIELIEFGGYPALMDGDSAHQDTGIVPPSALYQEIKEAISAN